MCHPRHCLKNAFQAEFYLGSLSASTPRQVFLFLDIAKRALN